MEWLLLVALSFGLVALIGAPYVPSHRSAVRRAFRELYSLSPDDTVVDIGSGDGRVLQIVSSFGAKAVGYEVHPILWVVSKLWLLADRRVCVLLRNAWQVRFPDEVTVVYIFSVTRDEHRLIRLIEREVARLHRPLVLICYGSPLKSRRVKKTIGGHHRYDFQPLHDKAVTV